MDEEGSDESVDEEELFGDKGKDTWVVEGKGDDVRPQIVFHTEPMGELSE